MKGVRKMIISLERMMKDTIETARHFYDKGLFDSLPKTTVSGKMFNSHSRLHYEEVSDLNSLYTRLILNFRLLIFNPPSNSCKDPTGRWIQIHNWHVIPKQNNRWWVSYTVQRRKKIFFTYHYEFTFNMKTKKIEKKGVRKMISSLERMMKDTIKTARQLYDKGLLIPYLKQNSFRENF